MANRWGNSGNSERLILGRSKITADSDCRHENKRCLLLGSKVMTNLDSILKSRDMILPTKVQLVKTMVFPVVMHGCENWTIKKVECWRIDAFEVLCWRRLLIVPWTARTSNKSILKDISPECSLEVLMLKLNVQYFGHLMRRTDLLEKTLMLGRIEGGRRRGWQRMRLLDSITDLMDMSLSKLQELVMPSNHLILSFPLLFLPSIFSSIRVSSNESAHIRWPKYWSFSLNISPSNEYTGLISFRMDWLDPLARRIKGLSRVISNTTLQKHQFFGAQLSL